MRIVFLGATKFSEEMLKVILENKHSVEAVFSIPKTFEIRKRGNIEAEKYVNSNFSDLKAMALSRGIPCYDVAGNGQNLAQHFDMIAELNPDVILVLGWYYIVPKKIRDLAKKGTFGIHASLLPDYAGGSPLVWAIINGEEKTGITMFKIEEGIDDGDILAQKEIRIDFDDTIESLYTKVTVESKEMLIRELQRLANDTAVFKKQIKDKIKPFPIRTPDDGLIDWAKTNLKIYNFVRAQTKPYPCAFSFFDSKKIKFISVALAELEGNFTHVQNGSIILQNQDYYIRSGDSFIRPMIIEVFDETMTFSKYFNEININERKFENE